MFDAAFAGFLLSLSLIVAIGSQNAFVLRQGLRGQFVLPLVLTCAASDAILITAGVAGFGALVLAAPWLVTVTKWGGACFLFVYGALNFRSAYRGGGALEASAEFAPSLTKALLTCLLLTWANPHVYLDTVVLLGSVAAQFGEFNWYFGSGAMTASFVFFFALGYGASQLRGIFTSPGSWRALDAFVGSAVDGDWELRVADLASEDQGTLKAWSLKVGA